MKDAKIKSWFTSNGSHIPVTEGQTKAEALREKKRRKIEGLERIYNSDLASGTSPQRQVPVPKAVGFNRPKTKHHLRHARDMGLNEKEYIKKAIEFFNSDSGELYKSKARGGYVRYDKNTRLMCAVNEENNITTFYKIRNKNDFNKKIVQDKLEKI